MVVDESARHGLYSKLTDVLGPEHTDTLMRHLPPTGWAEVATTRDLDLLRAEVHADVAGLRGEVHELRGELHSEMHQLRADFHGLRADLADRFRQQTLALIGAMVTLTGVTAAAAALL